MAINWNSINNSAIGLNYDFGASALSGFKNMYETLDDISQRKLSKNPTALELQANQQANQNISQINQQQNAPAYVGVPMALSTMAQYQSNNNGLTPTFREKLLQIESGGMAGDDPRINQRGYKGRYQIGQAYLDGYNKNTGSNYKLDQMKDDAIAGKVFDYINAKNISALQRYGVDVNDTTVYLAHNQGVGGTRQIMNNLTSGSPLSGSVRNNIWNNLTSSTKKQLGNDLTRVSDNQLSRSVYDRFASKMGV